MPVLVDAQDVRTYVMIDGPALSRLLGLGVFVVDSPSTIIVIATRHLIIYWLFNIEHQYQIKKHFISSTTINGNATKDGTQRHGHGRCRQP